jgi:hypothetical protein
MYLKMIKMNRWADTEKPEIEAEYEHGRSTISVDLNEAEVQEVAAICAKAMIRELSAPIKKQKTETPEE